MFSIVTLVILGLVVGTIYAFEASKPKYGPHEPQPVGHVFPFIGLLVSYAKNRRRLFRWGFSQSNNNPYSMLIATRKTYVFSTPAEMTAVYRQPRTLDGSGFLRHLNMQWFGYSRRDADRYQSARNRIHDFFAANLLGERNAAPVDRRYYRRLADLLDEMDGEVQRAAARGAGREHADLGEGDGTGLEGGADYHRHHDDDDDDDDGWYEIELLDFLSRTLARASVDAYFGLTLMRDHPDLVNDLVAFQRDGFWSSLIGVPEWIYAHPHRLQRRIKRAMEALVARIERAEHVEDGTSNFVAKLIPAQEEWDISRDGMAAQMFSIFFGLVGNSLPNAYSTLLRLVTHPGAIARLDSELHSAGYDARSPAGHADIFPGGVPYLRSFFQESLRVGSNMVFFREVLEDTTITVPYKVDNNKNDTPDAATSSTSSPRRPSSSSSSCSSSSSFSSSDATTTISSSSSSSPSPSPSASTSSTLTHSRTWHLKAGAYINLPSPALHEDPSVHPSPRTFIPERFLARALGGRGQSFHRGVKPFGGGTSYCPGRVFAEKQILALLAGAVERWDVRVGVRREGRGGRDGLGEAEGMGKRGGGGMAWGWGWGWASLTAAIHRRWFGQEDEEGDGTSGGANGNGGAAPTASSRPRPSRSGWIEGGWQVPENSDLEKIAADRPIWLRLRRRKRRLMQTTAGMETASDEAARDVLGKKI